VRGRAGQSEKEDKKLNDSRDRKTPHAREEGGKRDSATGARCAIMNNTRVAEMQAQKKE